MAKTIAAQIRQVLREDMKRTMLFTNKYKSFRTVKCYTPDQRAGRQALVTDHDVIRALGKIERIYAEAGLPFKMSSNKARHKWSSPSMIFYLPL